MLKKKKENYYIERILEKGLKIIIQHGLKGFTVEDLAKNLGMSKKTIYKYFYSKHILIEKIFDYFNEKITNKLKQIIESNMNPVEQYISATDFILDQIDQVSIYKSVEDQHYTTIIEEKFKIFRQSVTCDISSILIELQAKDIARKDLNMNVIASFYMDQIIFSFYPICLFDNKSRPASTVNLFCSLITEGVFTEKGRYVLKQKT